MLKHVPNILTLARIFLIPFILVFIFTNNYILAIVFLTLSGLTDVLDGFIARKFDLITNFGKLIDPLADKLTQVCVLTSLSLKGILPMWILAIVILKEFFMIAGASFLYGKELVVSSRWYGKLATVIFYFAIICSLFIGIWNGYATNADSNLVVLPNFDIYIYCLALVSTIFSLLIYYRAFYTQGYLKKENLKIDAK